ncbi:hypothetical protein DM02DRAFT_655487 [Periconia macrospinosa]|uniref:Uncharacterized protein n=1 Tax=Periconia macrospinosa TaxID=97972 RepID=A0A2V1DQU6_9PLEO|nr:hypothetical protein DM02DRAFT_655487 [Periconia macrospinosa]
MGLVAFTPSFDRRQGWVSIGPWNSYTYMGHSKQAVGGLDSSKRNKWLALRKDAARAADAWKYMDPAVHPLKIPILSPPPKPQVRAFQRGATSISELSDHQLKLYIILYALWQDEYKRYERIHDVMGRIHADCLIYLWQDFWYLVMDLEIPHERLCALKNHFSPTK